jgi:glycerate 2-kinase
MSNPRADVLNIFHAALAAVHGTACVERFLTVRCLTGAVHAVAVGKAAGAMLEGAHAALGRRLRSALLITKPGHVPSGAARIAGVTVMEAGHPVPDESSLLAGRALLEFITALPGDAQVLFLISGGASSLVEVLPPGMGLEDLQRVNRWLLASAWDIHRMNALRKRLSCIKGGRLAAYLQGRHVLQLMISDVPCDRPADIGSGLLVAEEDSWIYDTVLPPWLRDLLKNSPSAPPDLSCFARIETHIVATLDQALAAAAQAAEKLDYATQVHSERLCGDAAAAGRRLAAELLDGPASVHIWGGETSVELPANPGRGGRNQQLALAAAEVLAGHDKVWLLAAGTDGSDGPGEDAGAVIDGGTLARGELDGLNAAACLHRADAGSFFEASGDLISTGPTGTNVMDLVIGLKVTANSPVLK